MVGRQSLFPQLVAVLLLVLAATVLSPPATVAKPRSWIELLCIDPENPSAARTKADREAQSILDLITTNAPIYGSIRAAVVARKDVEAFAHHCVNGRQLVVFGEEFLQRVRNTSRGTGPYWAWVYVAAHEVGHLWRNHGNLRLPCVPRFPNDAYCPCKNGKPEAHAEFNRSIELEADYFAGFVLSRLGAKRDDAVSAMHVLDSHDTCTHPERRRRAEVVSRGWQQASGAPRVRTPSGRKEHVEKFQLEDNRDIYGGDMREMFGVSIEACARACLDNPACSIFSFDRWNNACFLKSDNKIADRFELAGFPASRKLKASDKILKREPKSTVGIRRNALDGMPSVDSGGKVVNVRLRNRSFFDRPARAASAGDWSDCAAACRGDSRCIAFNFFDRTCEIFHQTDGHYPAPGRTVGYLWVQNE